MERIPFAAFRIPQKSFLRFSTGFRQEGIRCWTPPWIRTSAALDLTTQMSTRLSALLPNLYLGLGPNFHISCRGHRFTETGFLVQFPFSGFKSNNPHSKPTSTESFSSATLMDFLLGLRWFFLPPPPPVEFFWMLAGNASSKTHSSAGMYTFKRKIQIFKFIFN